MDDEKEPKIPVLTVFKNGAILKNIFIVNKPQSPPPPHSISDEEILVVGRHPDCNIVLTHPSVSRFHLQIISDPSSNKLSLLDLSSVHGTWVSDKRIEPGVRVELSQGDTLRVGASTRLYRLHWIPISRAYQLDQVLNCSPAEMESADENQTSAPPMLPVDGDKGSDDVVQDKKMYDTQQLHRVNSLPTEHTEFELIELDSEVIESISSDDNLESIGKKIPSVPSVLEEEYQSEDYSVNSSKYAAEEKQISNFWAFGTELLNLYFPLEESSSDSNGNQSLQSNCVMEHSNQDDDAAIVCLIEKEGNVFPTVQMPEETQNQSLLKLDEGQTGISLLSPGCFLTENPTGEVNRKKENRQVEENNLTIETKSNLLVNMDLTQSDEKEEDANPSTLLLEDTEGKSTWRKDLGQTDNSFLPSGSLEHWGGKEEGTYPADQSILITDHDHIYVDSCPSSVPLVLENLPLSIKEVVGEAKKQQDEEQSMTPAKKSNSLGSLDFEHTDEVRCLFDETLGGTENRIVLPKDHELRDTISISSVLSIAECINSSPPGRILTDSDDKEFQVPKSFCAAGGLFESELCGSLPLRSDSVWARRGKPASAVQIQIDRSRGKTNEAGIVVDDDDDEKEEIYTPDKENFIPNTLRLRSLKMKSKVDTKQDDTPQEEELFTPDKENFTPVTPRQRSLKKKSKVEVEHSKSKSSLSKITTNFNIHPEDLITYPEPENQISGEITYRNQAGLEKKLMLTKVKAERMPFQSLLQNSAGKSRSDDSVPNLAVRNSTSFNSAGKKRSEALVNKLLSNKSFGERKRGWTLVADATTLLNKETRNSLQLLQGLKGTHLIIPGMVIRELDCLKQRGSLFRKKTEACLVLEWIEECMVKTNWWIHVQRSEEDERLIAPTPPAFPQSLFSKNNWGFTSGRLSRSFMELLSPAAEDHILDCALLRRKMNNDGQLVLLSNDVTLKIKAMEEGLICETAQEFHESLVNPLSERFMWAGSCARGRTWSYLADVVPVEKYNLCSLKKSRTGEGAKGVKLILLHNSHYGQFR